MSPRLFASTAIGMVAISLPFYLGAFAVARGLLRLWGLA